MCVVKSKNDDEKENTKRENQRRDKIVAVLWSSI